VSEEQEKGLSVEAALKLYGSKCLRAERHRNPGNVYAFSFAAPSP
jgi:hypothetical protein